MMNIEDVLNKQYGPLLSMAQLAKVLSRSPEGLRLALRTSEAWAQQVNGAKLKIGRRVYFRTSEIATMLTELAAHA